MRLSLYEIRKQMGGRLTWCVLALLLVLNMAFCYYFIDSRSNMNLIEAMKVAERVYNEDPEGVTQQNRIYKEAVDAYEKAYDDWLMGASESPLEPSFPDIPSTYYEGWYDYDLIDRYLAETMSADEYREIISERLDTSLRTMRNHKLNGYSPDSFTYRYQIRYYEVYSRALDRVEIKGSYAYGWDVLFAYSGTGLFVFLAAVFIGGRLFLAERDCGMHLLLRSARNGRGRQAAAKLFAAVLLSVLITVLLFASTILMIGWKIGFSSPTASVQQIEQMLYCPYDLNMITCLLLTVALTVLAALTILLLTALCSLITRRALLAMLLSAVWVGLSYALSSFGEQQFLKYVNLFSAVSGETLFGQWRAVHFFDHPVPHLIPLTVYLAILLIGSAIAGCIIWNTVGIGVSATRQNRWRGMLSALVEKLPRFRLRNLGLGTYERQKLLPPSIALICVALIALKIFLSADAFNGELSYQDELKLLYMEQYADMTLQETSDAVSERLAYYAEITSEPYMNDMALKRVKNEITAEEYTVYTQALSEASAYQKTLASYGAELLYLLDKEVQTGINTKPVFGTGVRTLLSNEFEPILALLFILIFCGSYAREYETGFKSLMHSTKKGRAPVFYTKLMYVILLSFICTLVFTLVDFGLVFVHYDMTCVSAPLFAIQTYSNTASGITVGQYLLMVALLRLLTYTLFGMVIAGLSGVLRSEWSAAGVTLLLFIPYLLNGLGLTVFETVDFTTALSVDRLWLRSTALGGIGFLVIFVLTAFALALLLTAASYRRNCK